MRPLPKHVNIHNNWWLRPGTDTPEHLRGRSGWYDNGCYCASGHYLKACGFSPRLMQALDDIGDPTELAFDAENDNDFHITPRQKLGLDKLCANPSLKDLLGCVSDIVSAPAAASLEARLEGANLIDDHYSPPCVELWSVLIEINDCTHFETKMKMKLLNALFISFLDCRPVFIGF